MVTAKPVLRIHQAKDGRLWYGDDRRVAYDSGQDLDEFVTGKVYQQFSRVRLLGTPGNADLVERLHTLRKKAGLPDGQSVQVGSPAICRDPASPPEVLQAMWHCGINEGVGGRWVELEDRSYSTYALVAELRRNGWRTNEKVRQIMQYHPAWPALSFIPTVNVDTACLLIGKIIDPRWYLHIDRPNRVSKLFQFLGLTPANAKHIIFGTGEPDKNLDKCSLVYRAWMAHQSKQDIGAPERFLHRILGSSDNPVRGFLNSNKKFIRFVRDVWLHELTPNRMLFDPQLFFRETEEITAYATHRRRLRKPSNFV